MEHAPYSEQHVENVYAKRIVSLDRTIDARPIDVTPASSERLLRTVYSNVKIAGPPRFRVGDPVRVSNYKIVFAKGYTTNWTTAVFRVKKVQQTAPATYLPEDYRGEPIAGKFYEHELHAGKHPDVYLVEKVLRRRGNEVLIKWLGLNNSHNSWINKNNVI
ncbi:uncharacterized protein LOC109861170 [Pseudomyrmex gracilis]|uniref:uncharacterized protein LOC109861170 n=1 Tax=Pseudomyrmex gracilis TaxID=219809 RepID=UPI0009953FEB|nr:uncharacterized protein LOC109861170 [Pseudomyrmex gracilis]